MNTFVSILSKEKNSYVLELHNQLNTINIKSSLVIDDEISNSPIIEKGFIGLNRLPDNKPAISWEKAFYNIVINNYIDKYDYFYFIEDDVYSKDTNTILELIEYFNTFNSDFTSKAILPKEDIIEWPWWEREKDHNQIFKYAHRSFNPFCKISTKLLSVILDFKKQYGKFYFHEILFASLCVNYGLSYHDYSYYPNISNYMGIFRYRPEIDINSIHDTKIYHPVKNVTKD